MNMQPFESLKTNALALTLTLALASQAQAAPIVHTYDVLGDTLATGANDSGDVVGLGIWDTRVNVPGAIAHGWIARKGSFNQIDLGTGNFIRTYIFGINSKGDITGYVTDDTATVSHCFLYTKAKDLTFYDYPGAAKTECQGINTNRKLVGTYYDANDVPHAFTLNTATKAFRDVSFPDSSNATGYGIDDVGNIVGSYQKSTEAKCSGGNNFCGFIRTSAGAYTTLMHPNTTSWTIPRAIANGQVVGYYFDNDLGRTGFTYSAGTFSHYAPDLGRNYSYAAPYGISPNGAIVGVAATATGSLFGFYAKP